MPVGVVDVALREHDDLPHAKAPGRGERLVTDTLPKTVRWQSQAEVPDVGARVVKDTCLPICVHDFADVLPCG